MFYFVTFAFFIWIFDISQALKCSISVYHVCIWLEAIILEIVTIRVISHGGQNAGDCADDWQVAILCREL